MPTEHNCPFCHLASDIEIVAETELSIAFFDHYPVSMGHVLIVPKTHEASYFNLPDDHKRDLWELAEECKRIIDERFHPDGYNLGINVGEAAGQSVFHVHLHLIPRYKGDTPNPKGGVRGVIPGKQSY